jgi:TorA maturation chaperone TorD
VSGQPVQFVRTLAPEDQARANFYALLSRLFYAPADAGLLAALGSADELDAEDETLARQWRELCEAAARADVETLRDEFETTFIGTGRAPITLYVSAYSIKYTNEVPLAELRGELAKLGLARRSDAGEPEDHIAALCDVMRHLIAEQQSDLSTQKRFFERWIRPSFVSLCDAIERGSLGAFHKAIGRLAKTFFSLEQSAFEML